MGWWAIGGGEVDDTDLVDAAERLAVHRGQRFDGFVAP